MTAVRVLVGTRKGAFVLTSDGKREQWDVSGPHFAGWEVYHLNHDLAADPIREPHEPRSPVEVDPAEPPPDGAASGASACCAPA